MRIKTVLKDNKRKCNDEVDVQVLTIGRSVPTVLSGGAADVLLLVRATESRVSRPTNQQLLVAASCGVACWLVVQSRQAGRRARNRHFVAFYYHFYYYYYYYYYQYYTIAATAAGSFSSASKISDSCFAWSAKRCAKTRS
ncbi:conserved hypothetical protein [Trichinella spiralis]|uniref:hypothetical protein n=1 Tax=Trichinella spiralis TaxID=6334 RepID=UPI0001EFE6BD|nr:conserved hypothetical protein [Trichinella spiralis]